MMARDGPEALVNSPHNMPLNYQTAAPTSAPKTAPKQAPVSRLNSTPKAPTATGGRKTPKPKTKAAKKPHQPSGYEWRREGAGWDLRKVVWVDTATGGRQRKRPYLGHLSRSAFADMKKRHKGKSLDAAISDWICAHDKP